MNVTYICLFSLPLCYFVLLGFFFFLTTKYFSIESRGNGPDLVSYLSCMSLGKYLIFLNIGVFIFKWGITLLPCLLQSCCENQRRKSKSPCFVT